MELPRDIQCIIYEYAKPITRPDWKYLHKMTLDDFFIQVRSKINRPGYHIPVTLLVLYNICYMVMDEILNE